MHNYGMKDSPEYTAWQNIKSRCSNPNNKSVGDYGARGIAVCQRWLESFQNFFDDMGPRPSPAHSIERIENECGYSPGNCIWATRIQQANNRRANRRLTVDGKVLTVAQAAREFGIRYSTLKERLNRHWDDDSAVKVPVKPSFGLVDEAIRRAEGKSLDDYIVLSTQ